MATRWKGRNRSSSNYEQLQKLQEMESLLLRKDETIADLEGKLTEQLLAVKKLRRERDELRNKNASLVVKLAEVSRKNSINNNNSPAMPKLLNRSSTYLRSLPSTPGSPSLPPHHNNTTPTGTPPSNNTPILHEKTLPTECSIIEDSDTDYSDLDEDTPIKATPTKVTPTKTTPTKATLTTPTKGIHTHQPNKDMDDTCILVSGTAQFTPPKLTSTPPTSNGTARWRQSSESPPLTSRQRDLQSSGSSSASSESHEVRKGSHFPPPGVGQGSKFSRPQRIPSSEKLASTLRQMIPKRSPPPPSHLANTMSSPSPPEITPSPPVVWRPAQHNGLESGSPHKLARISEVTTPPVPIPASNSADTPLYPSSEDTTSMKVKAAKAKEKVSQDTREGPSWMTSDIIPMQRGRSSTCGQGDSISSEYFSSDTTPPDVELSLDVFSPMSNGSLTKMLRTQSSSDARVSTRSEKRKSAMVASEVIEEEEDQLNPLESFESTMRSRTQTLSTPHRTKGRQEFSGRVKMKQHRIMEMKRFSSVSASTGIARETPEPTMKQLELLSPELLERIRGMTRGRIYSTYGGKLVVMDAVRVIEEAYRAYRLRRRFLERKKEKREDRTLQRKRALSMRQPNRRPTMMNKKYVRRTQEQQQQQEQPKKDPMQYKEAANRLAKERLPHAHSGSRQELVESKRSVAVNPLVERARRETEAEKAKLLPILSLSDMNLEGLDETEHQTEEIVFTLTCEDEEETGAEKGVAIKEEPDSIPGSDSTNSLMSSQSRPLSIFSTSSIESSSEYTPRPFGGELQAPSRNLRSHTLPRPSRNRTETTERDLRLKTGIHYFNKKPVKGIQYLIKNGVLEDDTKKVADFFIHQQGLSKEKIGEFLGHINSEFNMAVLESLVERSNMGDKPIDEALREFQQMFRMPGEAQKIDRIMEVFALEYHKHNKTMGVFKSEDGAYILSFAIMMLHTSLHNPSVKLRTSKKQWLSMNRGTNDGENFPDSFLLGIFDRIQTTEFATGKDHTHRVAEIEKQLIGSTIQRLSSPHRYLVLKMSASEVQELNVRPGFRHRHRRVFFFFNDMVVVAKRRSNTEFLYKDSLSLLNILPVKFETHYYKFGVQLHAVDRETPYQFNCDSTQDREQLLQCLEMITQHLKLLDNERITALGTTLTTTNTQEATDKGNAPPTLVCNAGDLISSMSLTSPTHSNSSPPSKRRDDDFVPGVGDLLVTSRLSANFERTHPTENRISRDSGFSSQQLTPTPPSSPSLSDTNPIPLQQVTPTISPVASLNALSPSIVPPRSKSTDGLRQLAVDDDTTVANRSPSMEFPKSKTLSPSSNDIRKKERRSSEKVRGTSDKPKKSRFPFNKTKVRDSSDGGKSKVKYLVSGGGKGSAESSPQAHRKLMQNISIDSMDDSVSNC